MPLRSAPDMPVQHEAFTGVHFKMIEDVKKPNGEPEEKIVHCLVSTEVLQDRAANDDVPQNNVEAIFHAYRARIEEVAGIHYTAGEERPHVSRRTWSVEVGEYAMGAKSALLHAPDLSKDGCAPERAFERNPILRRRQKTLGRRTIPLCCCRRRH